MQRAGSARVTNTVARRSTATAASETVKKQPKLWELPRRELAIVCTVFAITGSSAAYLVRPTLRFLILSTPLGGALGLDENSGFIAGPWPFRVMYFLVMWPMYSMMLLTIGTLAGRGAFFRPFIVKMWSRVLPKPAAAKLKEVLA
uniref:DUF6787 domain-containing protein n=1 Tax=Neobodo designis TaxID=312471 RepID=A0A7S1QEF9_NEODS